MDLDVLQSFQVGVSAFAGFRPGPDAHVNRVRAIALACVGTSLAKNVPAESSELKVGCRNGLRTASWYICRQTRRRCTGTLELT